MLNKTKHQKLNKSPKRSVLGFDFLGGERPNDSCYPISRSLFLYLENYQMINDVSSL